MPPPPRPARPARPAALALRAALAALSAFAAAACGRPFDVKTPPGFVELEGERLDYDYRATTPAGVVTAVRVVDTDGKGDLAFWANVVNARVRDELGYAPLGEADLGGGGAPPGRLLRFAYEQGGKPFAYEVALFHTPSRLYVLEAGGRKDLFERAAEPLAWQRRTFRAR